MLYRFLYFRVKTTGSILFCRVCTCVCMCVWSLPLCMCMCMSVCACVLATGLYVRVIFSLTVIWNTYIPINPLNMCISTTHTHTTIFRVPCPRFKIFCKILTIISHIQIFYVNNFISKTLSTSSYSCHLQNLWIAYVKWIFQHFQPKKNDHITKWNTTNVLITKDWMFFFARGRKYDYISRKNFPVP